MNNLIFLMKIIQKSLTIGTLNMKKFLLSISLLFFILIAYGGEKEELSRRIEILVDSLDPSLPVIEPIFEEFISDVSVCKGPGHTYYLTGTTGDKEV
jgi:hypothetical protein